MGAAQASYIVDRKFQRARIVEYSAQKKTNHQRTNLQTKCLDEKSRRMHSQIHGKSVSTEPKQRANTHSFTDCRSLCFVRRNKKEVVTVLCVLYARLKAGFRVVVVVVVVVTVLLLLLLFDVYIFRYIIEYADLHHYNSCVGSLLVFCVERFFCAAVLVVTGVAQRFDDKRPIFYFWDESQNNRKGAP